MLLRMMGALLAFNVAIASENNGLRSSTLESTRSRGRPSLPEKLQAYERSFHPKDMGDEWIPIRGERIASDRSYPSVIDPESTCALGWLDLICGNKTHVLFLDPNTGEMEGVVELLGKSRQRLRKQRQEQSTTDSFFYVKGSTFDHRNYRISTYYPGANVAQTALPPNWMQPSKDGVAINSGFGGQGDVSVIQNHSGWSIGQLKYHPNQDFGNNGMLRLSITMSTPHSDAMYFLLESTARTNVLVTGSQSGCQWAGGRPFQAGGTTLSCLEYMIEPRCYMQTASLNICSWDPSMRGGRHFWVAYEQLA